MKGIKTVFKFTFARSTQNAAWKRVTTILGLIFFLLPAIVLPLMARSEQAKKDTMAAENAVNVIGTIADSIKDGLKGSFAVSYPSVVYAADVSTEGQPFTFAVLNDMMEEGRDPVEYVLCESAEEAMEKAAERTDAAAFILSGDRNGYRAIVVTPDDADEALVESADEYSYFIELVTDVIKNEKAGVSEAQMEALITEQEAEAAEQSMDDVDYEDPKSLFRLVLLYINIMLLYFLVLFYGKNIGETVVMEKSSKLMDTMLVSVKPNDLLLGKVFGVACASILQFALWIVCVVVGVFAGNMISKELFGASPMILEIVLPLLGTLDGSLVPQIIVAVLFIFTGFFLYCALGSIGGAAAGKHEDLAAAQQIFQIVLVASFLVVLQVGLGSTEGALVTAVRWIPFTSIMVMPVYVLLGDVPLLVGFLSLLVVLAFSIALILFAARVYRAMILYRGKLPKPAELVKMVKNG